MQRQPSQGNRGQAGRQRDHGGRRVHAGQPPRGKPAPRLNSRQAVLQILERFDRNPADLERIMDFQLDDINIERRDKRFIFEIAYGVIRRRMTLDYVITHFLSDKKVMNNGDVKRILETGVYQLLYLDRVPDHAAVNEMVDIAKKSDKTIRFAGLVNAILHSVITSRHNLPMPDQKTDLAERLAVEYSHPIWLIERWLKEFGLANTKKILAFNNETPSIFLRRKFRGISRQVFEIESKAIADSVGGYNNLFYRLTAALIPEEIELLRHGMCTVQAPSSGWIVAMLDVQRGDRCIDLCSAPGGKTTLMAELAGEEGFVVAAELKKNRLERVVESVARMQLPGISPIVCDSLAPAFKHQFMNVLLDAPCSGTGVMHRHPEARWIRTAEQIARSVEVQASLLDAAAALVLPGGVLVYATCSLEEEENFAQVERFLKNHPEFVLDHAPADVHQQFIDANGCLNITPYEHKMDGAFAARLKKNKKI